MYVNCPVCRLRIEPFDLFHHAMNEHPYFFMVWASLNMPWLYNENILYDEEGTENLSYEYLSELCEMIGNHTIGVNDINSVTTSLDEVTTCPICLEECVSKIRKINNCSHAFCADCITKWLTEHKTCPVCVQPVQIASTSSSAEDVSSSPSSMNTM